MVGIAIDEFRALLGRIPRIPLLRVCSVMNAMLRSENEPINSAAHQELVRAFLSPEVAGRILVKIPGQPVRVAFHRHQALFVAKEALLYASDDNSLPMDNRALGRLFLMANDHLHAEFHREPQNDEEQFIRIAVHMVPVQEAAADRVRHKMLRSFTMTLHIADQLRGQLRRAFYV
jgi:hypothetical protein